MKLLDLLLLAAVLLLAVAGFMVATALGFAVAGVGCAAIWFLLSEAP